MKSRRKTFFRFGTVLLVLTGFGLLYSHVGLLPGSLKDKAIAKLEAISHKKIVCDKILYLPFRGLSFENISIHQEDGRPFFSAHQLAVDISLMEFFREKKIVIRRLWLDQPVFEWSLSSERTAQAPLPKTVISGQIDVPVAPDRPALTLENLSNGPDFFLPENVYLEEIEVHNGDFTLRRQKDGGIIEQLRSIHMRMGFQKPPLLQFSGQVKLGLDAYATIDLNGSWDLKSDRFSFALTTLSQDVPGWLLDYQQKHFLVLEQGQFLLKTQLWGQGGGPLLFKSEAHLKEAQMRVSSAYYRGRMHLNAEGAFDTTLKKFTNYKGTLELSKVRATNISPAIQELKQLSGNVDFQPDLFNVRSMKGEFKNIPFEAVGSIRSFHELNVTGRIVSKLSIERAMALLPQEQTEKLRDFQIQGQCEAVTHLSGSLKAGSKVQADHLLSVFNATIKNSAKHIDWSQVSGELNMDSRGLTLRAARFTSEKIRYELEGLIPGKLGEPGWARLKSGELEIRADYSLQKESLLVSKGSALWPGIRANFQGDLTQWNDPQLHLRGDAAVRLEQLSKTSQNFPWLRSLDLTGNLSGPFELNGPWNHFQDWDLKMDAESPLLFAKNSLRFEKIEIQLRMKNRLVNFPYIHANFYGGAVGSRLLFDLSKTEPFFDSRTYLNNVDLSKLGGDLSPPNKSLSGALVGQLALRGNLGHPESYRGQGAVSATKGFLFQSTQFEAMGHLPLVKVEGLELVTFHELSGTFNVHDKKINTGDLSILGDTVNLSLQGDIFFGGQLSLLMDIHYSDAVYRGAAVTGGIVPLVVQQAGGFISQYRVSGTLKEPRYDKN